MTTSKQLKVFLDKVTQDERLLPSHISLYVAVLSTWSKNKFKEVFRIFRKDLMRLAHINSIATYHKCIRELDDYGYLKYSSSYNYYQGCLIRLSF